MKLFFRRGQILIEGVLAVVIAAAGLGMLVEAASWRHRRWNALMAAQLAARLASIDGVALLDAQRETERFLARVASDPGTTWSVTFGRPTAGAQRFYPLISATVRFDRLRRRGAMWPASGEETVVIAREETAP